MEWTGLRIAYPTLWSRLSRSACREQTANTVAALARRGHEVTLLAPRGAATVLAVCSRQAERLSRDHRVG